MFLGLHRVMGIIDKVNSSFSYDEFIKSRGATHVKSYRNRNDVSRNITTGLVQTHVNVCHYGLLYEMKICS